MIKFFFFFYISFLLLSIDVEGQTYNINIIPVRAVYNSEKKPYDSKINNIEVYYLFKYIEIERKINNKIGLSFGVYYSRDKNSQALGNYKNLYYNLDPSVRYYFNKKNNISGLYLGSGISYSRNSSLNFGRFASIDGSLIENNNYYDNINYNFTGGYKFCIVKNRISLDLKLNSIFNLYARQKNISINSENKVNIMKSNNFQNNIYNPYLDLKLGYRFGFKK